MIKIEIDMRGYLQTPGLISRKIWQELFNIYRNNGDLESMDSMLCDLGILEKYVTNTQQGASEPIYWTCKKSWTEILNYNPHDLDYIKIEYFPEQRKFTLKYGI